LNLHADAHDFDSQTSSLEEVSRKIFSAHFGQLAVIFLWISGMHFHGALSLTIQLINDPVNIKQSSQVVWPIVGQEILK
jgi:photosystem I P700 chlorophyll a apoprotein A1